MSETRCENYCEVFKDCSSGELGTQVRERRDDEESHIIKVQDDFVRESALLALRGEKDDDEQYLGRIVVFALQGECKGPTLLKNRCRNPYAQRFLPKQANF